MRILKPAEGRGQRSDLLDALALADANVHTPLADVLARLPRSLLAKSEVVVCGPAHALAAAPLRAVQACCRHVHVIAAGELSRLFADDALAAGEAPHAS